MSLTNEEKIQKAEEIYYRRNGMNYKEPKKEKNHILRNLFLLMLVILSFLGYQNKEYLLSEEFKKQAKDFLNTKININNLFNEKQEETENNLEVENNINEEKEENLPTLDKIIWPYRGTITSKFGTRNSTDSRVKSNHTGIDIAGNIGDKIVCSIDGNVTLVSEEGDLGKHVKIENNDLAIVYAHCNEIFVEQGAQVKQNDEIGTIGSTGNSTGPHLHFEVIKNGEYIDPLTILEE